MSQQSSPSQKTFIESLELILEKAKESDRIEVREIFAILAGKGYASLLILLSIPFCLPIQIPGISTPFGLILVFLGLRIAFARHLWWPDWILEKKLRSKMVDTLVKQCMRTVRAMQKIVHPRLFFLTRSTIMHRIHGLFIAILGLFLSLPLPIPLTNIFCALPIFLFGVGTLEDDGLVILFGYIVAALGISFFCFLFLFGKAKLFS